MAGIGDHIHDDHGYRLFDREQDRVFHLYGDEWSYGGDREVQQPEWGHNREGEYRRHGSYDRDFLGDAQPQEWHSGGGAHKSYSGIAMNLACSSAALVMGAAVGMIASFFLDPRSGPRRRERAGRLVTRNFSSAARPKNVPDKRLVERIRSKMGHVLTHPRAITVHVESGHAVLQGKILAAELNSVLQIVHEVPGVRGVENQLEIVQSPLGIPELQGSGVPRREGIDLDRVSLAIM